MWLLVRLPCFPCVCPLFRCLLLFAILAAPAISPFQFVPLFHCVFHTFLVCASVPVLSPFCNPCSPLHFSVPIRSVAPVRLPCFPCCASSVRLYSSFLSRNLLLFYSLCPSLLSLLCVRLLTHALYFPCVSFVPVPLSLCCPFCPSYLRPWAFRSPCACFQPRCPHLPGAIPPFPRRLSLLFLLRSRVFLPLFSSSFVSFSFHLEKKLPLKSCMISSVKYMFYSIFLVCLGKFS